MSITEANQEVLSSCMQFIAEDNGFDTSTDKGRMELFEALVDKSNPISHDFYRILVDGMDLFNKMKVAA